MSIQTERKEENRRKLPDEGEEFVPYRHRGKWGHYGRTFPEAVRNSFAHFFGSIMPENLDSLRGGFVSALPVLVFIPVAYAIGALIVWLISLAI